MSLNQLPNELIAHVGSFLSFKDNVDFGLCQKRIHSVLKRDGLDKPECKRLQFNTVAHPHCKFWLPFSTESSFIEETIDPKFNSGVGQTINKFRKIEVIDFYCVLEMMTEDVFKDLMKTKTKLSHLNIVNGDFDAINPNIFLAACKKFEKIVLYWTILSPELLCDQVFVDLMPNTRFVLDYRRSANIPLDGYSLTDRTLKALTDVEVKDNFDIQSLFTSFTISGIKTLVEELLKTEDLRVMYNLGILKFSEERNAVHWMKESAVDPDCPYVICRRDLVRGKTRYTIDLKDTTRRNMSIEFAINPVEV